jgi:nicotinamidase-related amidase
MSRTIRSIAGARRAVHVEPHSTALVLVDFQNEYFDGRLPLSGAMPALRQAQALVAHADRHGIAVFHVRHVNAAGAPLFAPNFATVLPTAAILALPIHHPTQGE